MKLLLVDDNKKICDTIKLGLEALSDEYTIITAYSGEDALQVLTKQTVNTIITDVKMSGISGIELLTTVKELYPDIQSSIIISGFYEIKYVTEAIKLQVSNYLVKPISIEALHHDLQVANLKKYKTKLSLILVDDEQELCDTLKFGLELLLDDFDVFSAYSGKEALRLIEKHDIDSLISDIKMSEMNGIELMKRAKELKPNIIIIAITGNAEVDTTIEVLKLGAANFLHKPLSTATPKQNNTTPLI